MICPRDQQALQESNKEGYQLHFCPECHGVYIRLNQTSSPGIANCIIKPDQRPRISIPEDEHAQSPITSKPMLVIKHKGVIIDYCPDSNSVWLDSGELEKISTTISKPGASHRKGKLKSATELSVDEGIAELVIQVAAEAIGALFTSW